MEKQFAPWTFFSLIEIVGGSQREERFDVLVEKMKALGLTKKNYGGI
jgi:aspartyl/asparaginyl-tRNA synthetase